MRYGTGIEGEERRNYFKLCYDHGMTTWPRSGESDRTFKNQIIKALIPELIFSI